MAAKKTFEVQEGETISECLDRISREGFVPVRRMEKPVFTETMINGKKEHTVLKQQIIFEAKPQ
ncbi:NETI motif-containing protein [Sinobaca sp. H24]|uniref:NETI motif-containing protein n=1 Tax=Sinobaca sp. H24 TaxID=2923376 RepID=UPI002079DA47|nr:NETI motif-containing protein [Sinobaca sp. H24]